MIVAIDHKINDPQKFGETVSKMDAIIQEGKLPAGLKPLSFLPSKDGRKGYCVWEVDTLENLKGFIEPLTGTVARNEYFEVDTEHAFGLPEVKEAAEATA